ncbi:MAG: hypothetical protein ACFFBP_01035 [Promethearchaeota archaeon]
MAYLLVYGKLTQGQLKHLTRFSKSTISTGLSTLINIGQARKEKIQGSRESYYFIAPISQKSIDFALGTMEKEIEYFKVKIKDLENSSLTNKKGYKLLLKRLKDAIDVYEIYQNILEILKNPSSPVDLKFRRQHKKSLTFEDFNNITMQFDPKLKKIEDDIIDFFMYESAYSVLSEFTLMIYVFFITRGILTQERIRELTGLSLGKVSQVVNTLAKNGLIEKVDKEQYSEIIPEKLKRQTIYSMSSIKDSLFISGINSFKEMIKWENKFKIIKSEMTEDKEELGKLCGYKKILSSIDSYLEILPLYKKASSIFLELLA